ncbi:Insulin-degrading enzyme [Chlamydiales bacterium STE3]|nr:Insulin-degrading enzyme [Chlamydiales bacterium STE3]
MNEITCNCLKLFDRIKITFFKQLEYMMRALIFLCLFFFQVASSEELKYSIIPDPTGAELLRYTSEAKQIRKIRLKNDLEAILISDSSATTSAAALTILKGSWDNPDEVPGLAHFLEHMLFLGTQKYPIESDYDRFLAEHGGSCNAFTMNDSTSYLFEVNHEGFAGALDRFSSSFYAPLFHPSGLAKERTAVDQEFSLSVNNDGHRSLQLIKELINEPHPCRRFDIGNKTSLHAATEKDLFHWFEVNYSANLMRLFVYSPLSLDELTELVVKDFSPIPNHRIPIKVFDELLFSENSKEKIVYCEGNQNIKSLDITWSMPRDLVVKRESKPELIVSYLLNYQGANSLFALLKDQGLIEDLKCHYSRLSRDSLLMQLSLTLSQKGFEEVEQVIAQCFEAINSLQNKTLPETLLEEIQQIARLNFLFKSHASALDMVMNHAYHLSFEEVSTYPQLTALLNQPNNDDVHNFLAELTVEKAQISLRAPKEILNKALPFKEKWFEIDYAFEPLSPNLLKRLNERHASSKIELPSKNPFLPQDLDLLSKEFLSSKQFLNLSKPEEIVCNRGMQGFYSPDKIYRTPKVFMKFNVKSPTLCSLNPSTVVMNDLFIKLFELESSLLTNEALESGLLFALKKTSDGMAFSFFGFRDSLENFLAHLNLKIGLSQVTAEKFAACKNAVARNYDSLIKEHPLYLASHMARLMLRDSTATAIKKKELLQTVDLKKFQRFVVKLFSKTFVEAFITGNINKEQALSSMKIFQKKLESKPYPIAEHFPPTLIALSPKEGPFFFQMQGESEGNVTFLAVALGDLTPQRKNLQQILKKALGSSFFTELRTRQQTGYAVYRNDMEIDKHLFINLGVQSNSHEPPELLHRFELFLESYALHLTREEMTPGRFEKFKQNLMGELQSPPKDLIQFGEWQFELAFQKKDFFWTEKRIEALEKLNYEEFVDFTKYHLGRNNKKRFGVLIEGTKKQEERFRYRPFSLSKKKLKA